MTDRATFLDDLEAAGVPIDPVPLLWINGLPFRLFERCQAAPYRSILARHPSRYDETTHSLTDHRPARL